MNYYWTEIKLVIILSDISKKLLSNKTLELEMFQDQHFVSSIKLLIRNQKVCLIKNQIISLSLALPRNVSLFFLTANLHNKLIMFLLFSIKDLASCLQGSGSFSNRKQVGRI